MSKMDEITIILQVTNKKHSDIYKYLIDQSTGHAQRSTNLRVYVFILRFCSKIVKFMFNVVPFKNATQ